MQVHTHHTRARTHTAHTPSRANAHPHPRTLALFLTAGIVGRTGAGKTSITKTLFRLLDYESGAIRIDGMHTQKLGKRPLRSSIAAIPQVGVRIVVECARVHVERVHR